MNNLFRSGAAALLACVSISVAVAADAGKPVTVDIKKFAFEPKELTVAVGTTVHWVNHDETPHTVTSTTSPKTLNSKAMDTDDTFDFTFKTPGDFAYLCAVHPFMTGVVHVTKK